jgi:predicted Rossmann fold flavoprotein
MGVSVPEVQVKIVGSKLIEKGPLLITHWGLSGPAILRLSAWGARELEQRNWHFTVQINWIPDYNEETLKDEILDQRKILASQKVVNKNPFGLPSRLWEFLCEQTGIAAELRWAELPAKEQNKLVKQLCAYELDVKGKTTYKEEFVTAGGILLSEIDANTMMSKIVPNLFFAGEILNVDGITGGFNFQNAWTTGFIAAKHIGKYLV